MAEQAREPSDAALARFQEFPQLIEQGLEHFEKRFLMLQLEQQLALATEPLAQVEALTQVVVAACQPVELRKLRPAETPREARARQTNGLADGVHADLLQPIRHLCWPAQREQR